MEGSIGYYHAIMKEDNCEAIYNKSLGKRCFPEHL